MEQESEREVRYTLQINGNAKEGVYGMKILRCPLHDCNKWAFAWGCVIPTFGRCTISRIICFALHQLTVVEKRK
jgi:hypothetical protein